MVLWRYMMHKPTKKRMLKKFVIALLLILLVAGFLRLYKLGSQSFVADEYIGINVSYGYYKTELWKYWDFNKDILSDRDYTRGQIYYWQVAQMFRVFEPGEFGARSVSAIWGMIGVLATTLVAYLVTKNAKIVLLAAFLAAISVSNLKYDRQLRMYAMFSPLFVLFSYSLFYFLESKIFLGKKNIISKFSKLTNLNWYFLPVVALFGVASMMTHLLTVNIVSIVAAYLAVMAVYKWVSREKEGANNYLIKISAGVVALVALFFTNIYDRSVGWLEIYAGSWSYLEKIMLDYSYAPLGFLFVLLGAYYLAKNKGKIGIWTIVSFTTILFSAIFFWDRSAGHQYIFFIQPFKIIIAASGIYFAAKTVSARIFGGFQKWFWGLAVVCLALLVNFSFFWSADSFYASPEKWNYSNYREAYRYYLDHKTEDSVLITRKVSGFYLWKTNSRTFNYGDEDFGKRGKLTLTDLQDLQKKYRQIWFITTDNDFNLGSGVRDYVKESFEFIETEYTNKRVRIWRWDNPGVLRLKDKKSRLRFGFITDVHCYMDANDEYGIRRSNWRCSLPMNEFVKKMNEEFHPDFVIEGGDFVDGRDRLGDIGFIEAQSIYNEIKAPKFHVLGNHEAENFTKKRWLTLTNNKKTYYYFDIEDYRIIALDGNYVKLSNGEIADKSPETSFFWKGMVDERQLQWLEETLREAGSRKKLVFIHQPPFDDTVGREAGELFEEPEQLRELFAEYGVLAVFSGHIEELCNLEIGGVRYFALQGFHKGNELLPEDHRFKDEGAFYQITVDGKNVKVEMFHREDRNKPYGSMLVNQESTICNNKLLQTK